MAVAISRALCDSVGDGGFGDITCQLARSACWKSSAEAYRLAGSFSSAFATIASKTLGIEASTDDIGFGTSWQTLYMTSEELPVKGGDPVSSSYSTAPAA